MRDIIARIEGDRFEEYSNIVVGMIALDSAAVSGVTMEEAKIIIQNYIDMWKDLRFDFDLEDYEQYQLCRETGVIYLDKDE